MTNTIGIMGCGWLGLPLAKSLIAEGYTIHGTTTSKEKLSVLEQAGINAFHVSISATKVSGAIADFLRPCDTIIINVPPRLRNNGVIESYVAKMQCLVAHIKVSTVKNVIFVSSTSVYGDEQGEVTEKTTPIPTTESGKQLLESEQLFEQTTEFKSTIVRFGGLIGPDRHPVTMLSGRENLKNGTAPVNLIHLTDCILILKQIIGQQQWGEIFNAVHPSHPPKQEYYRQKALEKGLEPPKYYPSTHKTHKTINSCKLFLTKMHTDFTPL